MESKKFLFVSDDGLIADIAWEVVKEDQPVKLWIKDPEEQGIADGFVPKTPDGRAELDWADVVVPQQNFTSCKDAIAYVKASPNRYVIKPSGEAQNHKRLLLMCELLYKLEEGTLTRLRARSGFQLGVHIEDVRLVNGEWLVTGTSGVVLIVCGIGPTMRQAQRQAYNRVKNVMIPNMYYREDIGDRWSEEDSDRLHSWGYLRE